MVEQGSPQTLSFVLQKLEIPALVVRLLEDK